MKLFSVMGPDEKLDEITQILLSSGVVHFEESSRALGKLIQNANKDNIINPYDKILDDIEYFLNSTSFKIEAGEISDVDNMPELIEKFKFISGELYSIQNKINDVHTEIINSENVLNQLDKLKNIDVNLDDLFSLTYYKFRFGRMSRDKYERLLKYEASDFVFYTTALNKEYAWLMYLTPCSNSDTVDLLFSKLDFNRVRISDEAHGTPLQAYEYIENRIAECKNEEKKFEESYETQKNEAKDFITNFYNSIKFVHDAFEIRRYASKFTKSFCLSGWVPNNKIKFLTEHIKNIEDVTFTVEDENDIEIPTPTKLKNNWFAKPFEQFVRMYGVPAYNEVDPTFFVALSYTILFGAMFGDVGQGILLVLLGILYSFKAKNSSFGRVISTLGVSSTVFGFVYGSFFGFEEVINGFIRPMRDINTILASSIAVGMIMITIAMLLNIINGIKQKNYIKILFGSNGLAGLVLYWAVTVWAIFYLILQKNIMTLLYGLCFMMLPFLLIFFSEPLSNLINKKKNHEQKIVEFVLQNFFEGFEVVLSYLTNTVSFIRVGAFVLSHAGMMLAVFQLAKTANGGTNWIVIIFGNLLVVGFEGFIVGIQILRLEFFEMFSRFYSGNGKEYSPTFTTIKKNK